MTQPYNVCFCASTMLANSLMAEAILNKIGGDRFVAHSAGVEPSPTAHPFTLEVLKQEGYDIETSAQIRQSVFYKTTRQRLIW